MKRTELILLLAIALVSIFSGCKKDQNTISGTITYKNALTGDVKSANNADVYLMATDSEYVMKTVADDQGKYMFDQVPDGQYFVEAEKNTTLIDYHGKSETFKVKGDDVLKIDLTLGSNVNGIHGIAVIDYNGNQYTNADTWVYLYQHGSDDPIDSVQCDDNGNYQFIGLEPGTYDVEGDYIDENNNEYWDVVDNISVTSGDFVEVDLTLTAGKKQ